MSAVLKIILMLIGVIFAVSLLVTVVKNIIVWGIAIVIAVVTVNWIYTRFIAEQN